MGVVDIMLLKIKEILDWAKTTPPHMILIEGKRVSETNLITKIEKRNGNETNNCIKFTAWCLRKSKKKNSTPYRVKGKIGKNGKIISMKCSCEAESKKICEHIVAVLIYCSKSDVESFLPLKKFPLQEKKVIQEQDSQYSSSPIKRVMVKSVKDAEKKVILSATKENVEQPIPSVTENEKNNKVTDAEKNAMKIIFDEQENELMRKIRDMEVDSLPDCCRSTLESLIADCLQICMETKLSLENWHRERRFRITGTSCYQLFTYVKNKNPDWKKKCNNFLNPKSFTNEYTDYGKQMESRARETFEKVTNKCVFETGLVISKLNPWLACSPDGVIFENGKPSMLLEIKCPFKGRNMSINKVKEDQIGKCLMKDKKENYSMKKKHTYYAQVQLGMAILNVKAAAFVLYSDFDNNVFILTVPFDDVFVENMLTDLKKIYYGVMVHEICLINRNPRKNISRDENQKLQSYIH